MGAERSRGVLALIAVTALSVSSFAQEMTPDAWFAARPAFARPEQTVAVPATCTDIAAQLPDSEPAGMRVDMAIKGLVTLAKTDGVLWYIAVCADPGIRVLCVTYEGNGVKVGDIAVLRGGYSRQNQRHVMLDPCLASSDSGTRGQ